MIVEEIEQEQSAEGIAKRYSSRPGFQLLGFREVGIPFYYLRLRAVIMAHKAVPPISEFIMKSIDLGLTDETDFGGFLGLEEGVVHRALVDLRQSNDMDLIAPPGSLLQQWSLTKKGRCTLNSAEHIVPEEVSMPVYYDGLLRRVVAREQASLQTGREIREIGAIQITPIPARKPELDEITIAEVNEALRAMARRRGEKRELLVIKAVLSGNLYYQRAILLIFQATNGTEMQTAFVVDGTLSQEHEQAFAAKGGLQKLGVHEGTTRPTANEFARSLLPPDLLKRIGDLATAEELNRKAQKALADVEDGNEKIRVAKTESEKLTERDRLESARRTAKAVREQLDELPVSLVETFEHRMILESALSNSKVRLLINSPWITAKAVSHEFLRSIERRLRGGLKLYIAYGLDPEEKPLRPADRDVVSALEGLRKSYPSHFRFTRVGDTHAKILICDSEFMVVTSFNWLSFRGDPNRTFRDERGLLVKIPEVIDAQFDQIVKRMGEVDARR